MVQPHRMYLSKASSMTRVAQTVLVVCAPFSKFRWTFCRAESQEGRRRRRSWRRVQPARNKEGGRVVWTGRALRARERPVQQLHGRPRWRRVWKPRPCPHWTGGCNPLFKLFLDFVCIRWRVFWVVVAVSEEDQASTTASHQPVRKGWDRECLYIDQKSRGKC